MPEYDIELALSDKSADPLTLFTSVGVSTIFVETPVIHQIQPVAFGLVGVVMLAALVLMLLIGISMVYLGVHFTTDVLVGWACSVYGWDWRLPSLLRLRKLKTKIQPLRENTITKNKDLRHGILLVHSDRLDFKWKFAYGTKGRQQKPISEDHAVHIASIGKTTVSALIGRFYEEGKSTKWARVVKINPWARG